MRIAVKDGKDFKMVLRFPSRLLFNGVTAAFLPEVLQQNGMTVTHRQAAALMKALNDARRHKDWNLVEVQRPDGTQVVISL